MGRIRLNCLIAGLFIWIVLGPESSHAQYSLDFQTNLISGVTSNWSGDYVVGSNTLSDVLQVQSGGVLSNHFGYVGYETNSGNNAVTVIGNGSMWINHSSVIVGYSGAGNSLVISNGGRVSCSPSPLNGAGYVG